MFYQKMFFFPEKIMPISFKLVCFHSYWYKKKLTRIYVLEIMKCPSREVQLTCLLQDKIPSNSLQL